jgi:hypothetical protein
MTGLSATAADCTNFRAAKSCGKSRNKLRMNLEIAATARRLFPLKTAQQLVDITGYPRRTVEYWLTGNAKIPSDALAMLLRSEWGVDFLGAVMGDAKPSWWRTTLAYFASIDALARTRKANRAIRNALDANAELNASISRANSLRVQDEDFYGHHADAFVAVARPSHSPVAPNAKPNAKRAYAGRGR